MNMWECLGVEQTKDINRIKSSYAKQLRLHHPEDDPQGFQMLKAAYEFAQKYVQINDSEDSYKEETILEMAFVQYWKQNSLDTVEVTGDTEQIVTGHADIEKKIPTVPGKITDIEFLPADEELIDFIEQMKTLYDNFSMRFTVANWEKLLKHDLLWNISNKKALDPMIQEFLMLHRNLPALVWLIFDDEFQWNNRLNELSVSNPPFVRIILLETCRKWPLNYRFVTPDAAFDCEKYTEFLRLTREAALENDVKKVKENFHQAIKIYNKEPQIYKLTYEFFTSQFYITTYGEYRAEYQLALDKLIELHVNDYFYYLMRAEYFRRCEDMENARADYLKANAIFPENFDILTSIIVTYQKQSMTDKAKAYMKYIRKIYPKTKQSLERQLETTSDKDRIYNVMASNDKILEDVKYALKFKFDPYRHGPIIFFISTAAIFTIVLLLIQLLKRN